MELCCLFTTDNHTVKHGVMGTKPVPVVLEKKVVRPVKGKGLYVAVVSPTAVSDGQCKEINRKLFWERFRGL